MFASCPWQRCWLHKNVNCITGLPDNGDCPPRERVWWWWALA
jgi:hypothetical protein